MAFSRYWCNSRSIQAQSRILAYQDLIRLLSHAELPTNLTDFFLTFNLPQGGDNFPVFEWFLPFVGPHLTLKDPSGGHSSIGF